MQETLFGTLQKKQETNMKTGKKGKQMIRFVIIGSAYMVIRFIINISW